MKIDNTLSLVSNLRESINRALVKEMNTQGIEGLVTSHGDILTKLFKHGELPKSQIAVSIQKDKSTVTTLINKLISLDYVQTRKNPQDSRSILVSLTDKGRALKPSFMEISERVFEALFKDIDEREKQAFRKTLKKMLENMEAY
ncbi:MarR family winged helix-turn-helix transcriptional regulator [Fusibacter sp. JL216-2]|uniref:MarR family winged helix-turn-helix transcriptional regulator n=1 Tax=Fusibacter sp. JL216-2 TaxID=3071453 RepID=UPI003D32C73D